MDVDDRLERAYRLLEEEEIDPDELTPEQRSDLALALLDQLAEYRNQIAICEETLARLAGVSGDEIEALYVKHISEDDE